MARYPYPPKRTEQRLGKAMPDGTIEYNEQPKLASNTDFSVLVERVFDEAYGLLLQKHKDYGPTNISRSPGGPLNGLRVRMHDKTARLNHLLDNGAKPQNESLRDTFIDLMNYSAIALMVLDGTWPNE